MTTNPVDPRETLRQDWSGAAPFWKKWDAKLATQSKAATDLIVGGAQLAPGMQVLDLASGTGQPALTIAGKIVPGGRVVASDMTAEMVEATRENARVQNIVNLEGQIVDAEHLPFPNGTFDRVTCRFGIMFIPDVERAFAEIRRVLKRRGRFSFLVWGALDENPMFAASIGAFMKQVNLPPLPPDAPTIFRFADTGKLASRLESSGFSDVVVTKHQIPWPWLGTPEDAWESVRELAATFKRIIAGVPPERMASAVTEVLSNFRRYYDGRTVNLSATVILATGSSGGRNTAGC